eukprot:Em0606g4a
MAESSLVGPFEWRNTPTVGMGSSPCQRLLARRTRGVVPMAEYKREPVIEPHVLELEKKLKKQGTEGANSPVKWQGGIGSKNRQEAVEEKQISISGPTPTRIAVFLAGTGVGGEEVPVAIRKYFEDIAILLRNHPTVLPTTMLGLTRIDKNEAIVVRTTMASQQLGISPDAMLREIAYSHSRCLGKGERKFRFKVEGGYQQANCLGFQPNCLPLLRVPPILRTSPKTLFSLPHLKEQEMPPAQPQKEQEPQLKEQEMPPAQPQKEQEVRLK